MNQGANLDELDEDFQKPEEIKKTTSPKNKKIFDTIEKVNNPLQLNLGNRAQSFMPELLLKHNESSFFAKSPLVPYSHAQIVQLDLDNKMLKTELLLLRNFIKKNFKAPELLGKISDPLTREALDRCFFQKPLVVLAFASPLIRVEQTDTKVDFFEMDLLDYNKEFEQTIRGLSKTKNAIEVKQIHGTLERFQHALTDNPVGLHFSGHGISGHGTKQNSLVFETIEGTAHYVSQVQLKSIISKSTLKFVFIASCHGQAIGSIFQQAGVNHVICIQQHQQVLDEAAVIFSQNFYELLFKGKLSVCEAFKKTKEMLEGHPDRTIKNEAMNWILLKGKIEGKLQHECEILGPYPAGEVLNLSPKPRFPFEVAKVEEFVGRQFDMYQLITCIIQNRLTTLKGIPGIGKTTVAKSVGSFLAEREMFQDGIIFISMIGHDQTSQLVKQVYINLNNKIDQHHNQQEDIKNFCYDEESKTSKQFDQLRRVSDKRKILDQSYMETSILECLKERKVLLIIDNLENTLQNDRSAVRDFLQNLLERLPCLKILITSRQVVTDINEITEKVHELKNLSKKATIQLLQKKAKREIKEEEKVNLFKLKLSKKLEITMAKPQSGKSINQLEDHHLCDLLAGHPATVSLIAPLLQEGDLAQLYKKLLTMMSSKNFIQNLHELNPMNSLKVSLDASIKYVRKCHPQAIDLFCLFGMLPGGISDQDFAYLWQEGNSDWHQFTDLLKKYSLLVERIDSKFSVENSELKTKSKYMLQVPFMNKYAESLLKPFELRQYQELIVDFLTQIFSGLFKKTNVKSKSNNREKKVAQIQLEHEINTWSCINRICAEYQEGQVDSSRRHKHHIIGYSSTDEYEQILTGEMATSETENDCFEEIISQKNISDQPQDTSIYSLDNQFIKSQLSGSINKQQLSVSIRVINSHSSQNSITLDLSMNEDFQLIEHEDCEGAEEFKNPEKKEKKTSFWSRSKNSSNLSVSKGLPHKQIQKMQNQSQFYDQKLKLITRRSEEISLQLKKMQNSTDKIKVKDLVKEQEQLISETANIKKLSLKLQKNQILQGNSTSFFGGKKEPSFSNPINLHELLSLQVKSQNSEEEEGDFAFVVEERRAKNTTIIYDKKNTFEKKPESPVETRSRANPVFDINELTNLTPGSPTTQLQIKQTQSENINNIVTQKSNWKYQKTNLETIQEKIDYLSSDGLFIVTFVSVQFLTKNFNEAQRVIEMVEKSRIPDALCFANLIKIKGLISYHEQNFVHAIEYFEKAKQIFQKRSIPVYNLGIAQCTAAEAWLFITQTEVFISNYQNYQEILKKAALKSSNALEIYKGLNHNAGQAFSTMCLYFAQQKIKNPDKIGSGSLVQMENIEKFQMQIERDVREGRWIERIDGEQYSLLTEIVGESQFIDKKKIKRVNEIRPKTWIPDEQFEKQNPQVTSKIKHLKQETSQNNKLSPLRKEYRRQNQDPKELMQIQNSKYDVLTKQKQNQIRFSVSPRSKMMMHKNSSLPNVQQFQEEILQTTNNLQKDGVKKVGLLNSSIASKQLQNQKSAQNDNIKNTFLF